MISPAVSSPADSTDAERLERDHVHKVYNEIASHFTVTRENPWPNVKKFIDGLEVIIKNHIAMFQFHRLHMLINTDKLMVMILYSLA